MRWTQTYATTQSEQTLIVPIEVPPCSGLRGNYNILKGYDSAPLFLNEKVEKVYWTGETGSDVLKWKPY